MIPVETDRGRGYAMAVIDYSQEHDLMWVVIIDDTREVWTVPNHKIRVQKNWTMTT